MPTTRRNQKKDLLPGLDDKKRVRKTTKAGPSKGKKKQETSRIDPDSPRFSLATTLLESRTQASFPETTGQVRPERIVWGPRDVPITDPALLPENWSADEPDLEEADYEAQIERCKERISEGLMPRLFEMRLEKFEAVKQRRLDMINSEPKGLRWEIVQRLDCLKMIEKSLEESGDKNENLPNVKAIMEAYRSKKLDWNKEFITYWSKGELIVGPTKLELSELYALSAKHGQKGFWVEGFNDPTPEPLYVFFCINPRHPTLALHTIWISVRNPATQETSTMKTTLTFDFLEDTGASSMRIFSDDVKQLETISKKPLPILGESVKQTAAGLVTVQDVMLQVNVIHHGEHLLPYWMDIKACVTEGSVGASGDRLAGVWLHHLLFIMSMPDNTRRKHVGTHIGEMISNLPIPDHRDAVPPPFYP